MKPLNTKLVLSALGIALFATPAFAKRQYHTVAHPAQLQGLYNSVAPDTRGVGTDPDPQIRSELSRDAGQSSGGY